MKNVGFLLEKHRVFSEDIINKKVINCLQKVGLYDVADKFPNQLSGGMQKRVSFARALISDSERGKDSIRDPLNVLSSSSFAGGGGVLR